MQIRILLLGLVMFRISTVQSNDSITIEVGVVFAIAAIGWGVLRINEPLDSLI